MRSARLLWGGVLFILLAGCASSVKPPSLALREYQTRTYQQKNNQEIFHAVLNALQDDGFVIDVADIQSGLVKGKVSSTKLNARETLQKTAFTVLTYGVFLLFTDGNMDDVETVSATITISPYGESMKVRTSFVYRRDNPDGETVEHKQITEQDVYQKFYSTIEKSIFYDEALQPAA
ncbi:hypothetical protein [Planctobacterium marinum]|uniref:hypothetical protein n=1 Tax=Planctobacterium marinum TaxID=1631968 RepID=UPI001E3361CB|nr:hypothetical protein [Planctobacterium marinum]MCC2605920.1 hypothetical protein [Planctobacterium marinum]